MSLTTFLVSAHYHGLCEAKILKNAGIAGRKCGTSHNEAIPIMAQTMGMDRVGKISSLTVFLEISCHIPRARRKGQIMVFPSISGGSPFHRLFLSTHF